jgi:hypothetical protein
MEIVQENRFEYTLDVSTGNHLQGEGHNSNPTSIVLILHSGQCCFLQVTCSCVSSNRTYMYHQLKVVMSFHPAQLVIHPSTIRFDERPKILKDTTEASISLTPHVRLLRDSPSGQNPALSLHLSGVLVGTAPTSTS